MNARHALLTALVGMLVPVGTLPAADVPPAGYRVGVARVDVTPDYPVRLIGFGFRRTESEGITQHIWAKALAIDDGEPAVLVTVDNCGIPARMVDEVADRLRAKANLRRERFAVAATHTHTAPMLSGILSTLFGVPIPPDHQQHIDRYTAELTDNLERVALAALADRRTARLSWGVGTVGFAINRRTKGGPVDHDLPVLAVRDPDGKLRAVLVNYACHCVTLSNNKISGDWAGFAQEAIEQDYPGATALISIGCGADSNPNSGVTGAKVDVATVQGRELAREVHRLLNGFLSPVTGPITARTTRLELPLADPPSRQVFEERAKKDNAVGYHAKVQLGRLDRHEALKSKVDYVVQTWAFGDSLAMAFLPGEVVVDYSLRLKRELDGRRLWINAYANDAPAYIPSERVLKEGGYEGGGAMTYYDLPGPFRPDLEQKIVDAVRGQLDERFKAPFDAGRTGGSRPLSPQQSQATIRVRPRLAVDLVAAEPLVSSPVAIDFGPDGRLWVAEMVDYPTGADGKYKPAGRIRVLTSSHNDGKYDQATVFLDNIPFPTGVTVWRKGVLVCAAPDILYAEDTDGDGKADVVKKLFSGFGTENYQARVNSLEYGLDSWVYGSCGLFGGTITSFTGKTVELGNRDFRIKPDEGILEPASGRTQQGRARNDWGDWFGCDNTNLCRHYPLPDHYLRRNPHAAIPAAAVSVPEGPTPNRLFPASDKLQLFKLSGPSGQTTSACGLGIYRDDLLGPEFTGNAFTCEPVNLLVHRLRLEPKGSTFVGRRAADEQSSEFLAATDPWFRPVQARTGPDGCLWVVDMHRFVIEHPRWIPPEDLAKVDVRAGSTLGRIFRVRPEGKELRPFPRLDRLDTAGLVAALDSPNGWQRDMAMQMLLWRKDKAVGSTLEVLVRKSPRPEVRLQALCTLDGLGLLSAKSVDNALNDTHPGVRRHAFRLAETIVAADQWWYGLDLLDSVPSNDAFIRLQQAFTLGELKDQRLAPLAGRFLAIFARQHPEDDILAAAILSSVHAGNVRDLLAGLTNAGSKLSPPSAKLLRQVVTVALALDDGPSPMAVLSVVLGPDGERLPRWRLTALAAALDALEQHGKSIAAIPDPAIRDRIVNLLDQARETAGETSATERDRVVAVCLLGHEPTRRDADVAGLSRLVAPVNPPAVQAAAVTALARIPGEAAAAGLVVGWAGYTPTLQSLVLDQLLGRDGGPKQLLVALEAKSIPAAQIDTARRQRLTGAKDVAIRERAVKLFTGTANPDRQKVLGAYQDALGLTGNVARGKETFAQRCATCHRLDDIGHAVGPDLASVATKTPQYLLQEILDPNRNVDSRYVEYTAATKNGRVYTGLLAGETATSITLRGQEGREEVLPRADLETLQSGGRSLMPEGLEQFLSKQDLADLIAYLTAPAGR